MKTTKADGGRRQLLTHIIAREAWYLVLDTEERKNFHCLAIMRHAAHTIRRTLDYLNERERRAFIAECRCKRVAPEPTRSRLVERSIAWSWDTVSA